MTDTTKTTYERVIDKINASFEFVDKIEARLTTITQLYNWYHSNGNDWTTSEQIQQRMPTVQMILGVFSRQQADTEDLIKARTELEKANEEIKQLSAAKEESERLAAARDLLGFVNQVDSSHATIATTATTAATATTKKPIKEESLKRKIRRQKQRARELLKQPQIIATEKRLAARKFYQPKNEFSEFFETRDYEQKFFEAKSQKEKQQIFINLCNNIKKTVLVTRVYHLVGVNNRTMEAKQSYAKKKSSAGDKESKANKATDNKKKKPCPQSEYIISFRFNNENKVDLTTSWFYVKKSGIPNSGLGLFAAKKLFKGECIGLYLGEIIDSDDEQCINSIKASFGMCDAKRGFEGAYPRPYYGMGIYIMNDPNFHGGDVINIKANITVYQGLLEYVNEDIMPNEEIFFDYNHPDVDQVDEPEKKPAKRSKRSR
jgi:hypothetical protein